MKYLVVFEKAGKNYSAYVPDLPGCIAAGASRKEAAKNIREAIEFHLSSMKEDSEDIPPPVTSADYMYIKV